jgi:hypothetical protein
MKPKMIFVVGHTDWGKSETLRYLVGDSRHLSRVVWESIPLYVRHMSNDDVPEVFYNFIEEADPVWKPCVVAPLCPNLPEAEPRLQRTLDSLKSKGYSLYFWVMVHQFNTELTVTPQEIEWLRTHGLITLYSGKAEARERAETLKPYILGLLGD